MAFSVTEFREKGLINGGARPNLFEVQITSAPPATVPTINFPFLCKIAQIPPSTMGVVEVPYFGRQVKVPGNRTFDNLSITVINDEDFAIRNGFEAWMNKMNSHEDNKSLQPSTILGGITITHRGRTGNEIGGGTWNFVNCFPVSLGEITLDWGSNDTIEEYTVDWAFDYWTHGEFTSNLPT